MTKPVPAACVSCSRGRCCGRARPPGWPPPKKRSSRSSLPPPLPPPPKNSLISCARCLEVLRMLTTAGDIAFAMLRKVLASTGPLSGALFIGGAAAVV